MQVGISMWSYVHKYKSGDLDIAGFIDTAKSLGADGVELLDFFWKDKDAELPAVKAKLESVGLPVSAYAIGNNLTVKDPEEYAKQVDKIRVGVHTALALNTRTMRVFAGNRTEGLSDDEAMDLIIKGLKEGAVHAEKHGVTLCLENHGLLAGKGAQVKAIIEAVGSPNLKANFDTGNFMLVNENPTDSAKVLAPLTGMVHFKDFRVASPDETEHVYEGLNGARTIGTAIGEGDVDLPTVVQTLKDAGFDGYLTIEYEGVEDPDTAMPRSVAYAKQVAMGELAGNAPS